MSSTIQFKLGNYTTENLLTQTTNEKHIEDDGAALNDLTLSPLDAGDVEGMTVATIKVSTGHNGEITLNFFLPDSETDEKIGSVVCTDLKNPENPGVLKASQNKGYIVNAVGQSDIGGGTQQITITISPTQ